jgi:DNA-binding response OmpR family regulator
MQVTVMTVTERLVLLAEPDQASSMLYQHVLRVMFEVITAADKDTVLRILHTRPIDALVLDPMIFALYHWEQLATVGRICAERGIPLVLCSTLDERRRGIELGATMYLIKPTLPTTLLDTLQQLLGSGRI